MAELYILNHLCLLSSSYNQIHRGETNSGGEETNLPNRRTWSNMCRSSPLQEVELNLSQPAHLVGRLNLETCFKRTECEKGRTVTLQWRSLADSTSTRRSVTTTSDVTWTLWLPDRMRRERQLISVIFFPQTCNPRLIVRRTSDKPKLRDILQNTWRVLFKSWKEKWENSHRETSRHNN